MKKAILLALTALGLSLISSAQTVRTNYRAGGITHISTEYEELSLGEVPAQVRVELAGFQDGSTLYLLYINLVQKNATAVPKGVKMAVNLQGGKLIRLEQIGELVVCKAEYVCCLGRSFYYLAACLVFALDNGSDVEGISAVGKLGLEFVNKACLELLVVA